MNLVINTYMSKSRKVFLDSDGSTHEEEVEVQWVSLAEYNRIQIEWIEKHKYFMSEKAGYDVGFNTAVQDWVNTGLAVYFRELFHIKTKENN